MIMMRRKEQREGDPPSRFVPGELVRHRRYGYRGVVVALDLECCAPDEWYHSNQTQPSRSQPWYHVLVHHSHQTTYAAEENLEEEHDFEPIVHPLLDGFFDGFENGRYVRNDHRWGA